MQYRDYLLKEYGKKSREMVEYYDWVKTLDKNTVKALSHQELLLLYHLNKRP